MMRYIFLFRLVVKRLVRCSARHHHLQLTRSVSGCWLDEPVHIEFEVSEQLPRGEHPRSPDAKESLDHADAGQRSKHQRSTAQFRPRRPDQDAVALERGRSSQDRCRRPPAGRTVRCGPSGNRISPKRRGRAAPQSNAESPASARAATRSRGRRRRPEPAWVPGSEPRSSDDTFRPEHLIELRQSLMPMPEIAVSVRSTGIGRQHHAAVADQSSQMIGSKTAGPIELRDETVNVARFAWSADPRQTGDHARAIDAGLMAGHIPKPGVGSGGKRFGRRVMVRRGRATIPASRGSRHR